MSPLHSSRLRALALSLLALVPLGLAAGAGCVLKGNYGKRFSKAICEKQEECDTTGAFDVDECISTFEDSLQKSIDDDCEDYSATLAGKCLKDIKKAECDSNEESQACEDFNDKCGYDDTQPVTLPDGSAWVGVVRVSSARP